MKRECNFERWADLMNRVYKQNDNGKWALLYAIMCEFRPVIEAGQGKIPLVFFAGPASSGKTQIALSIRSLFSSPSDPVINLSTCTVDEVEYILRTRSYSPEIFDEFNETISEWKLRILDQITKLPSVLCGQQKPDGIAVFAFEMPKTKFSPEQTEAYHELKTMESSGILINSVLSEIGNLHPLLYVHFNKIFGNCLFEIRNEVGLIVTEAFSNTYNSAAMFLATCKFMEEHSGLKLPFPYYEFKQIVVNKLRDIIHQSMSPIPLDDPIMSLRQEEKRRYFFSKMEELSKNNVSLLHIKEMTELNVKYIHDECFITFNRSTKLLFVNLSFDSFLPFLRDETERNTILLMDPFCLGITAEDIDFPIKSHTTYTGETRIKWVCHSKSKALVFIYDKIREKYGIER